MKQVYLATLCVALVVMNFLSMRTLRQKNPLAKALRQLTIAVTVTVVPGMAASFAPTADTALFLQCVHYACTEWLLVFLLRFMEQYTEDTWSRKAAQIIIYSLTVLNSVSLLLNSVFHHVVSCTYTDIGNGVMGYLFTTQKPWYHIHLIFTYILVFCNLSVLISQMVRTTRFYRRKYSVALFMLICTIASDVFCTMKNYPLDYSLYAYIALAMFLTYFSVYYIP